jgi:D-glycero-D-manno-heptose 1,7-bisphosphate phosphatase
VFLDRDGVIVVPQFRDRRSFAPTRLEDFRIYPEAPPSVERLKQAGFLVVVVTNQPDVERGVITITVLEAMHRQLARDLPLDAIKTCPHGSDRNCDCRKPKPGLLFEAARELGIDLPSSFMVGDRRSDVEAGLAAGCTTVFIDLGYAEPLPDRADFTVGSIAQAVDVILATAAPMQEAS